MLMLLLLAAVISTATAQSPSQTMHEALRANGLPIGLLPLNLESFRINLDGTFSAVLSSACIAQFENEVHYAADLAGALSPGRIFNISGISAQDLFLWFPVKDIHVDLPSSGVVYFDVGVVSKRFSLSLFQSPPECRSESADVRFSSSVS